MDDEAQKDADRAFRQVVERSLERLGEAVVAQGRRISDLARNDLEQTRAIAGLERLLMAVTVMGAQLVPDRLQYVDQVRGMALDAIPVDDQGSTDRVREPLERLLAKVEAAILSAGQP
jgi:hypothetical protein